MTGVKSSQLSSIGFDDKTGTLAVKFNNGGTYHYHGVTKAEFEKFSSAESAGKHFSAHIKNRKFTKIPEAKHKK